MITYRVKANENLFNRWQELGFNFQQLGAIVQNDAELSYDDITRWLNALKHLKEQDLEPLTTETVRWINES